MSKAKLIKVGVKVDADFCECEWLWAHQIGPSTAKIDNIPFFTDEFTLGDIVEFDHDRKFVRVVERGARTAQVEYDDGKENYRGLVAHLKKHDIHCEGCVAGFASICVPTEVDDDQLNSILASAPCCATRVSGNQV